MKLVSDFINLLTSLFFFFQNVFSTVNCTSNLSRSNFDFIAFVEVDISSKKLHSRKYFQDKSSDHIRDIIYRTQL